MLLQISGTGREPLGAGIDAPIEGRVSIYEVDSTGAITFVRTRDQSADPAQCYPKVCPHPQLQLVMQWCGTYLSLPRGWAEDRLTQVKWARNPLLCRGTQICGHGCDDKARRSPLTIDGVLNFLCTCVAGVE